MTAFDRLFNIMIRPWIAISYICFIVLSFVYFDKPVAYFFHNLDLKINLPLLSWITKLGIGAVYMIGLLLLALFFRYIHRNKQWEVRSWFLWLCVLGPNLISLVLKVLLGRARPVLLFDEKLYGFFGLHSSSDFWSMPSGHTTTVMGLMFGLSIVFPRYFMAFILSGLVIISTRILLTDHYISDVLVTSYLTLIEVGVLLYFARRQKLGIF